MGAAGVDPRAAEVEEEALSRLANVFDRALSRLVPEIVASACVAPETWTECIYCTSGPCIWYSQCRTCHLTCSGGEVCTGWHTTWI